VHIPVDVAAFQQVLEVGEVTNSRGHQVGGVALEGEAEAACRGRGRCQGQSVGGIGADSLDWCG
jgi:hypothetical protein